MNNKIYKLNVAVGYGVALLGLFLCIAILSSMIYGTQSWPVHAIVGLIALGIGSLFFRRTRSFSYLEITNKQRKFVRNDLYVHLLIFAFMLLLVCMALHRIFNEKVPVFG